MFHVKKCPHVNFFCQAWNLPGFGAPAVPENPNPWLTLAETYDHLQYENLVCTFKVDEKMMNYLQIYSWMKGIGFPDDFDQYAELESKPRISEEGLRSDILVQIMDSNQLPKFNVNFHDAMPINIGALQFDSRMSDDIPFLTVDATFKYNGFDIERVT